MLKFKTQLKDLSAGLTPEVFGIEDLGRFGINGGISALAYDPVQSLLAAGTDSGRAYVFGQPGVEVEFDICPGRSIIYLRIVRSMYMIVVDGNNTITVVSFDTKEVVSTFTPSSPITAIETDAALDWLFVGLESGLVIVFDVDRGIKAPFRISNLQKLAFPRASISPVVFIALHPRSYNLILIGYESSAIVYSMVDDKIIHALQYELPPGAPGGDLQPSNLRIPRYPKLCTGAWHPNGHHIVTAYEDGSFVFWDAKQGVLLQARTIEDTEINKPRRSSVSMGPSMHVGSVLREPIFKLAWCCTQDPEDTSLIVAGGGSADMPLRGLTYMDFGPTPTVQITSYQYMGDHYAAPRRQRIYPIPAYADPVDFIMIPSSSPYYGGNHNPKALIAILSSGELYTIDYPSGAGLPVASMFPPSLCWIQPRVTILSTTAVKRNQWTGMMSSRRTVAPLLIGGSPAKKSLRQYDTRNILVTGHADGSVHLWDASHGEIEDSQILDVSIAEALDRADDVRVDAISFAGQRGEIAVASVTGEVVLFKFGRNNLLSKDGLSEQLNTLKLNDGRPVIQNILSRANPNIKDGFLPYFLLNIDKGPVTSLKTSEIGFLAIGYQFGSLAVVETQSSKIIYVEDINNISMDSKKTSVRSGDRLSHSGTAFEVPLSLEFSIMSFEDDNFSSIILSVGTSFGRVLFFRIVPTRDGHHTAQLVSIFSMKSKIIATIPFDTTYGLSAVASPTILQQLPQGVVISGAIIVVTPEEARVIKPPKAKIASKSFEDKIISAGVSYLRQGDTLVLVCLTESGYIRVFSLPYLKEMQSLSVQRLHHMQFAPKSIISLNGDVVLGMGKYEAALLNIWGKGVALKSLGRSGKEIQKQDALYDALKPFPPRPQISTIQWVGGTKYVTQEDLDLLSMFFV
ncbi:lethal giant larvae like, C-terminal-domain-containing protein [Dipodascopsis uninucleata]